MKKLFLFTILVLCQTFLFAQEEESFAPRQREKLNQFRKLKLIEVLNLTENESIKFFARYNEFQNNIESLQKKKNSKINELQKMVKGGEESFNEQKFNEITKQISAAENEFVQTKNNFFNNLTDILPKYKIAKLIVFEREFFNHLRNLIGSGKKGPGQGQGQGFRRND